MSDGGCFAAKRFAASPRALRTTGVSLPAAVILFLQKPCNRTELSNVPPGFPKKCGYTSSQGQGRSVSHWSSRGGAFGCDAAAIALDAAALRWCDGFKAAIEACSPAFINAKTPSDSAALPIRSCTCRRAEWSVPPRFPSRLPANSARRHYDRSCYCGHKHSCRTRFSFAQQGSRKVCSTTSSRNVVQSGDCSCVLLVPAPPSRLCYDICLHARRSSLHIRPSSNTRSLKKTSLPPCSSAWCAWSMGP